MHFLIIHLNHAGNYFYLISYHQLQIQDFHLNHHVFRQQLSKLIKKIIIFETSDVINKNIIDDIIPPENSELYINTLAFETFIECINDCPLKFILQNAVITPILDKPSHIHGY